MNSQTSLVELLYVIFFSAVFPLIDYLIFWPAFQRRSSADPTRARRWLYVWSIFLGWGITALGVTIWLANDRTLLSIGLTIPDGWRLWTSISLIVMLTGYLSLGIATIARSPDTRSSFRQQMGTVTSILPHTRFDMFWFGGLSLTAGFCEEFLYRGYFIWFCAPWFGWWGAALISVLFFACGHLYQGWNGVIRTGIVGALFTLVLALTGSLWTVIVLHFILDLGQGIMSWQVLREEEPLSDPS